MAHLKSIVSLLLAVALTVPTIVQAAEVVPVAKPDRKMDRERLERRSLSRKAVRRLAVRRSVFGTASSSATIASGFALLGVLTLVVAFTSGRGAADDNVTPVSS